MKNPFFNDDVAHSCSVCARCRPAPTENEMLCIVKGIVPSDYLCRKFRYDPLKREPREAAFNSGFSAEDFKI